MARAVAVTPAMVRGVLIVALNDVTTVGEHAHSFGQHRPRGVAPGHEVAHRVVHLEASPVVRSGSRRRRASR